MTIAVTGDHTDLAEAVAGFTARHADVSALDTVTLLGGSGTPGSTTPTRTGGAR